MYSNPGTGRRNRAVGLAAWDPELDSVRPDEDDGDCNPDAFPHGTIQADVLLGGLPNEAWDRNAYGGCGGWVQAYLLMGPMAPEVGAPGSWAPSVPYDSPGVTSEELRAATEAPGYVSPTVPGLNDPWSPDYVWDPTGEAVPDYDQVFEGAGPDGIVDPDAVTVTPGYAGPRPGEEGGWGGGGGGGFSNNGNGTANGGRPALSPLMAAGLGLAVLLFALPGRRRG